MASEAKIILSAVDETAAAFTSVTKNLTGLKVTAVSVLGALGVAASTAGFVALIKGSIDAADHLNDLSKSTALAVGDLAGLSLLAKQSGTDLDGLAKGVNRMSVEMGKSPEKFQALGITAKSTKVALQQFADLFNTLPDIQQRNALAQAVFAKSWAEMAPALAEGGKKIGETIEKGARLSASTKEMSAAADEFNDKLAELTGTGGMLNRQVAPLLPLLNSLADGMLEAQGQAAGLTDGFSPLAEAFRTTVVLGGNVSFVLKGIGTDMGAMAAQLAALGRGDLAGFGEIGKAATKDAEDARTAFDQWEKKVMSLGTALGAVGDTSDAMTRRLAGSASAEARSAAARAAAFLAQAKEAKEVKSAYDSINKTVSERLAQQGIEIAAGRELTDQEKFEAKIRNDLATTTKALTAAELANIGAKLAASKLQAVAIDIQKSEMAHAIDIAKERQRLTAEGYSEATALGLKESEQSSARLKWGKDTLEQIEFETLLMTMNTQEREAAIVVRDMELQGIKKGTVAWDEYAAKIAAASGKRGETRQAIDDFRGVWESVDRTAHDTFVNIFEGGKNAFTKLRDTLKATLLDLLYQMTVKKWVFNIAASVTGTSAGIAQAATGGMGGGMGMLGSLGGMASSLSGGAMDTIRNIGTIGSLQNIGSLAAGGEILGAIGAAAPYIGIALAAISLFSGKGGGPKTEAGYSAGLDISGAVGSDQGAGSQRGDVAAAQKLSEGISGSYEALAKQLGLVNQKLDVGIFYAMDNAKGGTSLTQLQVTSSTGYNRAARTGGTENVARGEDSLKAALAEETVRLLVEGLKGSDLPQQFKDIFDTLGASAGIGEMNAALGRVTKARAEQLSLEEQLYQLTHTDAEKMIRARERERAAVDPLSRSLLAQVYAQQDLLIANEATTKATEDQARAQESLRQATEQANRALADRVTSTVSAYAAALQTTVSSLGAAMNAQQGYADALKRFRLSLSTGPLAQLSPEARYNSTSAEFDRLSSMPLNSEERMSGLADAGQAFLEASQAYNASSTKYFVDLAKVKGSVQATEGAALTAAQLSRMQLNVAQSQLDLLQGIKTNTGNATALLQAMTNALIAQIRAGGSVGSNVNTAAIAAATGGITGTFSMVGGASSGVQAYTSSGGAVATMVGGKADYSVYAKDGSFIGSSSAIKAHIDQVMAAGNPRLLYDEALQLGISLSDLDSLGQFAPGSATDWARSQGLPTFARGGNHAGGWAMVGEQGPELAYLPPARIYNAQDSQRMVGGDTGQIARLIDVNERQAALIERLLVVSAEGARMNLEKQDALIANTAGGDALVLAANRAVPS
jgi:hypothetical protein